MGEVGEINYKEIIRSRPQKRETSFYFSWEVWKNYLIYGYSQLFVIGPQGMGKTRFAMLCAYEIYGDWDYVLQHLFFDPYPAFREMRKVRHTGQRIPLIIFDDAGLHFSKYLIATGREGYYKAMLINYLFNVIRSMVSGVILTSPDDDILKELRKKSWLRGQPWTVRGLFDPVREMHYYRIRLDILGRQRPKKLMDIDRYHLNSIPQDVAEEYEEKRWEAIDDLWELIEAVFQKVEEGRGDKLWISDY